MPTERPSDAQVAALSGCMVEAWPSHYPGPGGRQHAARAVRETFRVLDEHGPEPEEHEVWCHT